MRRILITADVVQIANDYATNLFKNRRADFVSPLMKLKELSAKFRDNNHSNYADYIDKIIEKYDEILKLKPSQFQNFRNQHFSNLDEAQLRAKVIDQEVFYEQVVQAMRYDEVQKTEIRPYMKKLGIKACVYCNAAYAVVTDDNKAAFQVDHYYPKSKYPFLCTSFFNLQPSCMHCNQIKSQNTNYEYCMYTDDYNKLDPFYFTIEDRSIIKYMLSHDNSDLKYKLNSNAGDDANQHASFFHIDGLYSQYSDAVEELVWKAKIYNNAYLKQLQSAYLKKFPYNIDDFKRFVLGFYPDAKDVNLRPLTLLMQGIAKDMNFE